MSEQVLVSAPSVLQPTPWWRFETVPGLCFESYRSVAAELGQPVIESVARSAFRWYRGFVVARLTHRIVWVLWFLVAAYSGTYPALIGVAGSLLVMPLIVTAGYSLLRWFAPETVAADRAVRAVALASSWFERSRRMDAAETRRFVAFGGRFSRAVFACLAGSRWFAHGHPGLDDAALRVAATSAWTAPSDFRSLTPNERDLQLTCARRVAAFIVARDFQGAALEAERQYRVDESLFVGDPTDRADRDRCFEAFGPRLFNTRFRLLTGVVPWASLVLSASSLAVAVTFGLTRS